MIKTEKDRIFTLINHTWKRLTKLKNVVRVHNTIIKEKLEPLRDLIHSIPMLLSMLFQKNIKIMLK